MRKTKNNPLFCVIYVCICVISCNNKYGLLPDIRYNVLTQLNGVNK